MSARDEKDVQLFKVSSPHLSPAHLEAVDLRVVAGPGPGRERAERVWPGRNHIYGECIGYVINSGHWCEMRIRKSLRIVCSDAVAVGTLGCLGWREYGMARGTCAAAGTHRDNKAP